MWQMWKHQKNKTGSQRGDQRGQPPPRNGQRQPPPDLDGGEVPDMELGCPARDAIPQPPPCWDKKSMTKVYHPDKNPGCPKLANRLFSTYHALPNC